MTLRNKLTHEYFGINIETIRDTIKEDLSAFKEAVLRI